MRRHHDPIEVRLGPPHGRIGRATVQSRPASSRATHRRATGEEPVQAESIDHEDDRLDDRGPGQFIWRGRIWRVLEVESRWRESGSWWTGPAVRAARGEIGSSDEPSEAGLLDPDLLDLDLLDTSPLDPGSDGQSVGGQGGDLLCEVEVWRVEAANGRDGSRGIYDLAHSLWSGQWHLRGVFD